MGTMITDTIGFRTMMLYRGLKLEVETGMKLTNKANVFAIIKREYNLKGTKKTVLAQFEKILKESGAL